MSANGQTRGSTPSVDRPEYFLTDWMFSNAPPPWQYQQHCRHGQQDRLALPKHLNRDLSCLRPSGMRHSA